MKRLLLLLNIILLSNLLASAKIALNNDFDKTNQLVILDDSFAEFEFDLEIDSEFDDENDADFIWITSPAFFNSDLSPLSHFIENQKLSVTDNIFNIIRAPPLA